MVKMGEVKRCDKADMSGSETVGELVLALVTVWCPQSSQSDSSILLSARRAGK